MRDIIWEFLAPKLGEKGSPAIDEDTNLMGSVLLESVELLELVVWVEEKVQVEFNPDSLNLEDGLTVRQLIGAFQPTESSADESSCA